MRQGCFTMVLALFVAGEASAARKDALVVQLNQQGLDLLAEEVSQRSLAPIDQQAIDDQETKAAGIDIRVEGASFSARFSGLKFKALNDALSASVMIEDVKVDIARIKLSKKVFRATMRSTCKDTTVKLGHRDGESLGAVVALRVAADKVVADVGGVDFSIDDENYEVHGPSDCTGDLGMGYIVRAAVRLVLDNAREKIEDAIKDQVADLSDDVELRLNAMTHQTFALDLTKNPLIQGKALDLVSYPSELSLRPDDLTFKLGVSMTVSKAKPSLNKDFMPMDLAARIGAVSINPAVLSDAVSLLLTQQTGLIWLDESRAPGLKDILTQSTAASIWPDLQNRVLDTPQLRLGLRLLAAPVFKPDARENVLGLDIPSIAMEFYIREGGVEKLYTTLTVGLTTLLQPRLAARTLTLGFAKAPQVSVAGAWGPTIAPDPDLFEADVAEVLLSSIFAYLYASGSVFSYGLPPITLGGASLLPMDVRIGDKYLQLGLGAP